MRNLNLTQLAAQLWHDERGFVQSAELILIGTLAVIGLIVGLAAFRDGAVQELGDSGVAVGQLDQSYAVEITGGAGGLADITVVGIPDGLVTITGDFGAVTSTSTFNNYSYDDQPDQGDNDPQAPGDPPAGIEYTTGIAEGQPLP
ncbi:MAG: hypothetical protein WD045_13635 [Pirellulaceae bacterium]